MRGSCGLHQIKTISCTHMSYTTYEYGKLRIREGDMYFCVPTKVLQLSAVLSKLRAMPKSVSFTWPLSFIKMFCGLISPAEKASVRARNQSGSRKKTEKKSAKG